MRHHIPGKFVFSTISVSFCFFALASFTAMSPAAMAGDAGLNAGKAVAQRAASSSGNTFYVRPDGSDANTGTSNTPAGAWRTLQYAANHVAAGDTVLVADGTYAGFYVETSGAAGSPITFRAPGAGADITSRNSRTADGINVESWEDWTADYITIDGFNVYNQTRMGIRAAGGTGVIIQNCKVHNNSGQGIFSGDTPSIQVLNNTTYANGSTSMQHNIYLSNAASDYCVVRGNTVYSSGAGNGIQLNGDWEMGGDGFMDYCVVENNIVHDNAKKGLSLISIRHGIIRNNIIYNNGSSAGGIHIVDQLGQNFSIDNVVVNNTIDEPNIATVRINAGSTGNVVFNNISIGPTGIVFEGSGNYQSVNYSASTAGTSIFVNASARNYHLLSTSPARDYGAASFQAKPAPAIDIESNARPWGPAYDAGAYEFTTLSAPSSLTILQVSPF